MVVAEGATAVAALAVGVLSASEAPRASLLVWPEEVEALAPVLDLVAEAVALEAAVASVEVALEAVASVEVALDAVALAEAALEVAVAVALEVLEVLGVLAALGLQNSPAEASTRSPSTRASCSLST